ncbi:UNVERIFIED_CONTAM: hypothetical protein GTU68_045570, partial [Idotea baltica]|nr:hypothetical protein [Idotea baltica]
MTSLTVRNLTKSFGALKVTDDVSLDFAPGEIHAIIGPNGAGKTTLISQLSGQLRSDSGTVAIAGRDVTRLSMPDRVKLGLARSFQITSVLPGFTALENVALAVQARKGSSFRFFKTVADEAALNDAALLALREAGLEHRSDIPAKSLSHGEHRRLELAIALATEPKILLLDEPLAGVGGEDADTFVANLQKLKGRFTIVLIEHDMDAVFALADRVSVLVYGQIIATGTPEAVRSEPESQILFGIDLSVKEGEVVTLLGRNGMGKTTTIKSIFGLVKPRAGRIRIGDKDLTGAEPHRVAVAGLGYVPEGRQIFPTLNVEENLRATARTG